MTASESNQTLKLVSMAYGVAIQPDRFDDLLIAWDAWFDANILDAEGAFDELAASFEEAVSASESLDGQIPLTSAMDQSPSPGILLDKTGTVLDVSRAAEALYWPKAVMPKHCWRQLRNLTSMLGRKGWARTVLAAAGKAVLIWRLKPR